MFTGTSERVMNTPALKTSTCACCGAKVHDEYQSCHGMFETLLEKEYSDPAFGESHLFTVDAYALQHSEEHGPRSNAFHLMRLCWLVEHRGDASIRQVRNQGRGFYDAREANYREFPFLAPPKNRGALTVAHVVGAKTALEHSAKARAWGESVWATWIDNHAWARRQVRHWFAMK